MRRETWHLLGVLLASLFFLGWSQAANAVLAPFSYLSFDAGTLKGSGFGSPADACAAARVGGIVHSAGAPKASGGGINGNGWYFSWAAGAATGYCKTSPTGGAWTGYTYGQSCGYGVNFSGGSNGAKTCGSCPSGYVEENGACVLPSPCPAAGTNASTGYYDVGTSDTGHPVTTACLNGCEVTYSGSGVVGRTSVNGVYHYWTQGSYDHTHQTCSGGSAPTQSTTGVTESTCDPATQDTGQVNGVTVCLNKSKTATSTSTTTIDPVTGDKTITETSVNPDGTTETKTTVVHMNAGGEETGRTSTTEKTQDSFCQSHPSDPTCAGKDGPTECDKHPDTVGCLKAGAPPTWDEPTAGAMPDDPAITEVQDGVLDWHQVFVPEGSDACPMVDESANVMGQTITIPLSQLCPYLGYIKTLMIALATIASIRMFAMAPW